jgi:hypothetical protein
MNMFRRSDWFRDLFGFAELSGGYEGVKKSLVVIPDENRAGYSLLRSEVNGKSYRIGKFGTPSLAELRRETEEQKLKTKHAGKLTIRLQLGDVSSFQANTANRFATFQAASQFNCLEFPGPRTSPEQGITGYESDRTQGPACSISAGPATAYRNYFCPMLDSKGVVQQYGQTQNCQLDNLRDFNKVIGNANGNHFQVINGYTFATDEGLEALKEKLSGFNEAKLDEAMSALRVGLFLDQYQ